MSYFFYSLHLKLSDISSVLNINIDWFLNLKKGEGGGNLQMLMTLYVVNNETLNLSNISLNILITDK